jgi:hypothetical protein
MGWFWDMLQDLATENDIEAGVRGRDIGDITNQIDSTGIPRFVLQALRRYSPHLTFILAKILRHIHKVLAMLTIQEFASTGI